ncbi:MAG: hypothetical protein JXA18_06500 [Chitinispirillaceae bacterium]|nr:hypothetical protein [Chitinispirillaceae bacterium]
MHHEQPRIPPIKRAVVYKSLSGFTKKYAQWIAEELQADLFPVQKAKFALLSEYDLIVYGGSLHAVGISGVGIIKKNLCRLAGKTVVVFAVGASPPAEGILEEVLNRNFSPEQRSLIRLFYLRGGFDYSKLDLPGKILMTLLKWKLRRKPSLTGDEKGILDAYDHPVDFTDRATIAGLVRYVRSCK